MNLIETFQDMVAHVPELIQPLIVALAAAVPFIEGEGAVTIGILGGINPVVAAIAAMIGNFVCVALLVYLSAGARDAVVTRRRAKVASRELVGAGGVAVDSPVVAEAPSARAEKFQRALVRYGVPGVSLLGPLLLPTQFTATMLAAAGVSKPRILLWQGIAIFGWTTAFAIIIGAVVGAVH